jgi:hypothetical protein
VTSHKVQAATYGTRAEFLTSHYFQIKSTVGTADILGQFFFLRLWFFTKLNVKTDEVRMTTPKLKIQLVKKKQIES